MRSKRSSLLPCIVIAAVSVLCLPQSGWSVSPGAMPSMYTGPIATSPPSSARGTSVINTWAGMTYVTWDDHYVDAPRILLAKMTTNTDIANVNTYLLLANPGNWGSSYEPLRTGDYDFAMITLCAILYQFDDQPSVLYPTTLSYLVRTLLNAEGGTPSLTVPGTGGLIPETENHILMTETSRYLKNQWLHLYGAAGEQADPTYNNATNGLETWFSGYLDGINTNDFAEYNSMPYQEYTLQALLTLQAYAASSTIANKARYLVDQVALQYALGGLHLERCAPYNRRRDHKTSNLTADKVTAMEFVWTDDGSDPTHPAPSASSATLMAALLPYALPTSVRNFTLSKSSEYFVGIGRGSSGSPEIFSGGPGYCLTTGGYTLAGLTDSVARPIVLLLEDGMYDIQLTFHIHASGGTDTSWNNTGIFPHFAVADSVVYAAPAYSPVQAYGNWKVYQPYGAGRPNFYVVTYSEDRPSPYVDTGCIIVVPNYTGGSYNLLVTMWYYNQNTTTMRTQFTNPIDSYVVQYDKLASKGTWVISNMGNRTISNWTRLSNAVGMDFSR